MSLHSVVKWGPDHGVLQGHHLCVVIFIIFCFQLTGQPVLIGGTMGTCSYVLTGTEKGMSETFGSTCHGAVSWKDLLIYHSSGLYLSFIWARFLSWMSHWQLLPLTHTLPCHRSLRASWFHMLLPVTSYLYGMNKESQANLKNFFGRCYKHMPDFDSPSLRRTIKIWHMLVTSSIRIFF